MSCHVVDERAAAPTLTLRVRPLRVALVGQPNVGKSVVVYPCGNVSVSAGDTRVQRFADIWNKSAVFEQLRRLEALEGKCGECGYGAICGGRRARAYAATGSFLAEEPFCSYRPDLDTVRLKADTTGGFGADATGGVGRVRLRADGGGAS